VILFCASLVPLSPLQRSNEGHEDEDFSSGWRGFLSSMGLSIPAGLCRLAPPALRLGQHRMLHGKAPDIPEHVLRLAGVGPGKMRAEWSLPGFITMFLPEFPHKTVPGHEHFQVELIYQHRHTSCVRLDSDWIMTVCAMVSLSLCLSLCFTPPGVKLHRQRFLWTHSESEGQDQAENICGQSESSA